MADNYIGKKMEDFYSGKSTSLVKKRSSLKQLLLKNRSYRGYDNSYEVRADQLQRIIEVNCATPSAMNQQVLRFRPVLVDESDKVLPFIRMGGALPELHLPLPGTEPKAFIVICSTVDEGRYVDIDLGIAAQSMLLQAVEIGLNGICIAAFDKTAIKQSLSLQYEPLLILAIGKGAEKIELTDISPTESHAYYRREGVHYVPKLRVEDLIIK
jgi:nitroreductase